MDDHETVDQITEIMYMQYFLGYSSFTTASPFDVSLFVSYRKILGIENVNAKNEKIVALKTHLGALRQDEKATNNEQGPKTHSMEHRIVSINQPHVRPIVRGKSQAKTAYAFHRIRARLQNTGESWIACIFMVLNLVKLAWASLPCLVDGTIKMFFSKINYAFLFHLAREICNTNP